MIRSVRALVALSLSIAVLLALARPRVADASVDATITGLVQDSILSPVVGATVIVHDAAGATVAQAKTDAKGRFKFTGIPLGDYTVEASSKGLLGDHQHLQLTSGQIADVELTLINMQETIEITEDWSVPEPTKATGSVAAISRQTLQELPGADDRPVTDVLSTQPGMVADALGNVYARGNHANIQYQVDGIPVPDSVGSLFAASIPVRLIQNLEIYTGGMPAEFGDRLGTVVNLVTRQGGDVPEGSVQMRYGSYNTYAPGVAYSTKLSDKVGMFVGASLQDSERALDPPSITPILHDDGYTARAFTRIDYKQSDDDRFELFGTFAHNRFDIPIDPSVAPLDPSNPNLVRPVDQYGNASPGFVPHDTNASETETEAFVAASWVHNFADDNGQLQVAPLYKLSRGVLFGDAVHALGALSDPGTVASDVTRGSQHAGGIAAYSLQRGLHLFKAGVEADMLFGRTEFTSYQRDDASPTGGVLTAATVHGKDATDALTTGVYAQDHWAPGKLALDMGLRVDEFHVALADGSTNDSAGVSPRLGASYSFDKDLVGHVFTGVNWQPPSPLDAANAARALGVVPANVPIAYDLKPETDVYAETGVTARPIGALKTSLVAWGRYAWNQLDDTAIGSTSLLSNYNFERGRAAGLEASADIRVGPWLSAFANGSLGVAQGQGISSAKYLFTAEEVANQAWQQLDHAQTWTANAGATVRDGRFSETALLQYGSGLRTGADNDQHVPGHAHVDESSVYTFTPNGYPVRFGVDIVNVFDAHYAYRIGNSFVGSSYGAPRTVYLSVSVPLAAEPKHGKGS
jgi:outer membrane cobalamin receptor